MNPLKIIELALLALLLLGLVYCTEKETIEVNVQEPLVINKSTTCCKSIQIVDQHIVDNFSDNILGVKSLDHKGDSLIVTVRYSGCDDKIDPKIKAVLTQNGNSEITLDCRIRSERNQLCYAVFEKQFCFDLSLLLDDHSRVKVEFDTPLGLKVLDIKS